MDNQYRFAVRIAALLVIDLVSTRDGQATLYEWLDRRIQAKSLGR